MTVTARRTERRNMRAPGIRLRQSRRRASPVRDLRGSLLTMPTLDDLFAALAGTVREGASAHGYEERPGTGAPGAFGARAARWRRAAAELALAWDPREQWVSFEFRPSP